MATPSPKAYYNEFDPFAAAWLRELIKAELIAPGDVDERSIEDIRPSELRGYTQCHFFAGIGVWSYALRRAGWPDTRAVWTGSCPCQPFSAAGKRKGTADERHLWPAFFHLIKECHPPTLFGEQVASKDGLFWIDTVLADLESQNYASWAWDLCSAGFGAPHIRQRLYFVGSCTVDYAANSRHNSTRECDGRPSLQAARSEQPSFASSELANNNTRLSQRISDGRIQRETVGSSAGKTAECSSNLVRLGHTDGSGTARFGEFSGERARAERLWSRSGAPGLTNGFWREAEWIYCRDEKFRPIEPGSSPLATGITNRVGKLRGYGNALTAEVAKGFIESYLESERV